MSDMLSLFGSRAMLNLLLLYRPCTIGFLSMKMDGKISHSMLYFISYIQVGNEWGQSKISTEIKYIT